jgi:hypothetical protein
MSNDSRDQFDDRENQVDEYSDLRRAHRAAGW